MSTNHTLEHGLGDKNDAAYIGQEARVTVDPRHTDEEVQNDSEVLWPTVCQCYPNILNF